MINHVRTLLLNKNDLQGGLRSGTLGAEFIDNVFQPQLLPRNLQDMCTTLLPAGYTAYQCNMTLAAIMQLLHSPELEPYTLAQANRFTYDLNGITAARLRDAAIELTASRTGECDLELRYALAAQRLSGLGSTMRWTITQDTANSINVQFADGTLVRTNIKFASRYSNNVPLINDYLSFRLYSPTEQLTGKFRFDLICNTPVTVDFPQLLARYKHLDLRQSITDVVFDTYAPYASQITELHQIWRHAPELTLRVGAYTLGYAYQLERLRLGLRI
jgi:hypothetical protein